jgi:tRNA1(Val) A37 N6-methylase TrmN6
VDTTDDAILNRRLVLRQPRRGHRFGHDAILLAAAVPAEAGQLAVEFGAGVGAAGLALAWRVPGLMLHMVEIEEDLAALARTNAARNGLDERVTVTCADVTRWPLAGLAEGSAHHVLMNPPFNDPARHRTSESKARAHMADDESLALWLRNGLRLLRPDGLLTAILRADRLEQAQAALAAPLTTRLILPKPEAAPIRVILSIGREADTPRTLPPLVLADSEGQPTAEAERVLRIGRDLTGVENLGADQLPRTWHSQ